MNSKNTLWAGLAMLLATVLFSSPSLAFCGKLKYSAHGATPQQALNRANNKGLPEVRRLNRKYGNRVRYSKAAFKCVGRNRVRCTITQRYCVAERRPMGPRGNRGKFCGPGKMRLEGKCIRRSEARAFCGPGFVVRGDRCVSMAKLQKPKRPHCPKGQVYSRQEGCHYDD